MSSIFRTIMLCVICMSMGITTQVIAEVWSCTIWNSSDKEMKCQAIDYSHFHPDEGCRACAYSAGTAPSEAMLNLVIGGKDCPRDCPQPDLSNIGVGCFSQNIIGPVIMKVPTTTQFKWSITDSKGNLEK